MELTVKERIVLLGVLPKEGDFKTLKQLRTVKEELSFSDEENKALDFRVVEGGNINWTEPGGPGEFLKKDVKISDSIMELIVDALVQADKAKKLNADTFDLYERFVVNAKDQVE